MSFISEAEFLASLCQAVLCHCSKKIYYNLKNQLKQLLINYIFN